MDKKRLGSFIVGGLVGALAGILFAPKSGRETRGNLADRAGEARQRSEETYFDARERLRERVSANREAHLGNREGPTAAAAGSSGPEPPENAAEPTEATGPGEADPESVPERPVLRDVSFGRGEAPPSGGATGADRSEALRRKVRETRQRIEAAGREPEPPSGPTGEPPGTPGGEGDAR